MDKFYTTADSEGLDPRGWYPGKKHGFLKNLGRVASMGIYSPDNRMVSKLNNQKLETRGQNQEAVRHMKELYKLTLESLQYYYAKAMPEKPPEEVAQMAARAFVSKFLADTEENNARGANAMVNKEKAAGLIPGAAGAAMEGQTAATAAARASTARNNNIEANERGRAPHELDAGAKAILTDMNVTGARGAEARAQEAQANNEERRAVAAKGFNTPYKTAQFDDIGLGEQIQRLQEGRDDINWRRGVEAQTRSITGNTMVEDAMRQLFDAKNAKLNSGAINKALSNPTTADSVAAGVLNKNSMVVPYGGTVYPIAPVDPATALQGQDRHPDVTTYGEKIDPTTGKVIPVIQRKVYGTNAPPTTAEPFSSLTGRRPIIVDTNLINSIIGGK